MSSDTNSCASFFAQEHANATLTQYFQQLNSQVAAAAAVANSNSNTNSNNNNSSSNNSGSNSNNNSGRNSCSGNSSGNSDSGNDGSMTGSTSATLDNHRSSVSSNDSGKSSNQEGGAAGGAGSSSSAAATNAWSLQQQQTQLHHHHHQQQQQHQHHQQQQHVQQQQQQHLQHQQQHLQQLQQQQHSHHAQQHAQQQHHPHAHNPHMHPHHPHQQQQQLLHPPPPQQQQQQHHAAQFNHAAAAAAANTNTHSIFGTGNFHYKTNNSWTLPTLNYQRLYQDNPGYHQRNNFMDSQAASAAAAAAAATVASAGASASANAAAATAAAAAVAAAATATATTTTSANSSSSSSNNNTVAVPSATKSSTNSNNSSSSSNNSSNSNVSSVQHVANAVAAAVIAIEHHSHLNNLKANFQPSSSGRKSPFLGFICKANGKSTSNSKEIICPDDKYKEEGDIWNVEAQTAFLGPNLWDKTLPYDADLKVTQYADLDEFLSENNIPDGLPGTHLGHSSGLGHRSDSLSHAAGLSLGLGHITTKRERSPSPSDCISPDTLNPPSPAESTFSFASSGRDFDPRTRAFSDEELKPQPMIKKSRKQFVPDELKDDKYWARRRKNNIAAKRSRDARRQKENQIAMRARYLEKENATLHQEVEQLKQENMDLRARLSKFQDV
ncbi:uncharacterized protein DDB_G0283357 isoform X1 [Drosophila innubila]|uniref:uncharacterized protein DDB_G0283357 isoform X1 n=1 Tax=Drosophila innubila TaxID=198719 RepID=UPI00148B774D|nr:uncharacterized protein DDB_G0283357 isoform X1 [Drosophila innubila]